MNRLFVIGLFFIGFLTFGATIHGDKALDEDLIQEVKVKPQSPVIKEIVDKLDKAKNEGNWDRFQELLDEYKHIMQDKPSHKGPEVKFIKASKTGEGVKVGRWTGDDILIDVAHYEDCTMDCRSDGTIYLAASRQQNSGDDYYMMPVWSSPDSGITWHYWGSFYVTDRFIFSPSMEIVETPDTDYLFIAFQARHPLGYESDVIVLKYNLTNPQWNYYYPASNPAIMEGKPSLDSDDLCYPSVPYLHLAFESGDSIAFIRSLDLGEHWTSRTIIGYGSADYDYIDPSCAYGWGTPLSDSFNLGVAWAYTEQYFGELIRFRKNCYKGSSSAWSNIKYFSKPSGYVDRMPNLKLTHNGYPSALISFNRGDTLGMSTFYHNYSFYTYDGGRTWSSDTIALNRQCLALSVDNSLGNYHLFSKGAGRLNYMEGMYDNFSQPSGWSSELQISGNYPFIAASAVLDTQPCVSWIVFASPNDSLKFDALWLSTGVNEDEDEHITENILQIIPNPVSKAASLSYSVAKDGYVNVSIYDVTGRLVKKLIKGWKNSGRYTIKINGNNYNPGVYLVQIKTDTYTNNKKMIILE